MTEVSREIGAKKPNTTRFVDKMIEKNLIRRRYGENRDKRYIYLEMTDFAKSLLETRQKIKLDYLTEQMKKNTTQEDRDEILKAFDSIISVLSKFDWFKKDARQCKRPFLWTFFKKYFGILLTG